MSITFDAEKLAAVALAQSTEKTRYYLRGVYFEGKTAVATDGHILTIAYDDKNATENHTGIFLVSKRAITVMKSKKAITVKIQKGVLTVLDYVEDVLHTETCSEREGIFPDYRRVIPQDKGLPTTAAFNATVLGRIAATAAVLNKGTSIRITGDSNSSPHFIEYGTSPDVFSVAMPMLGASEHTSALPIWYKEETA